MQSIERAERHVDGLDGFARFGERTNRDGTGLGTTLQG